MAVATRRLPGIRFEAAAPPPLTVLPRMDVAVFVGFAAAGPIDVPVAVRDPADFADIFGTDATLFTDGRTGQDVRAYLAPAVRAFFRNGGRRCFVVRVAGEAARAATFAVPGLVARGADGGLDVPLFRARSEGSWSDRLRVAAALVEDPVATAAIDTAAWRIELASVPTGPVVPGDLLRISLPTSGYVAYVAVASVSGSIVSCDPTTALWLAVRRPPAGASGTASYLDSRGAPRTASVRIERDPGSPSGASVRAILSATQAAVPAPGSLLQMDELWIAVRTSDPDPDGGIAVGGDAFWPVDPPAAPLAPDPVGSVEVCTFELWATDGKTRRRLGALGFAPGHARHAGALPTDVDLYEDRVAAPVTWTLPPLWSAAAAPRFPLAGPGEGTLLYPLGMGALPQLELGALLPDGTPLERDGLAAFGPELFLDARLAGTGVDALPAEADFYRLGGEPRLRGVQAALTVDEATILAVPDAVQRPWTFVPPAIARAPRRRHPHRRRPFFEPCGRLHPPELHATAPDETGSFALRWNAVAPHVVYVLQEARDPEFAAPAELYRGHERQLELHGRDRGAWYYRVRAEHGPELGPWSTPATVAIAPDPGWTTVDDSAYDASTLLAVQTDTLRVAAARGDLFAFLSLPSHYREDRSVAHIGALRAALGGQDRALGYGALHHPWPTTTEADDPTAFRSIPPDGTITGTAARRAFERGAWVAPANDPLRDVIALSPPIDRGNYQRLQDAQLNVLRQEPHGFLVLSADTLVDDVDVRPINVRRLLQLLRRAALLHGPRYVFEPNGDALHRRIQRGFEDLLGLLFRLGAFAGATASEAYRVEVGDPPNTPASVDAGRLIVELKVAPSYPLRFLVVRLVERAERGVQLEGA